jgi:hypothetical protein
VRRGSGCGGEVASGGCGVACARIDRDPPSSPAQPRCSAARRASARARISACCSSRRWRHVCFGLRPHRRGVTGRAAQDLELVQVVLPSTDPTAVAVMDLQMRSVRARLLLGPAGSLSMQGMGGFGMDRIVHRPADGSTSRATASPDGRPVSCRRKTERGRCHRGRAGVYGRSDFNAPCGKCRPHVPR